MAVDRKIALAARIALPLLLCMGAPAAAQYGGDGIHSGTLEVPKNKSQVITTDRPIAKAMVGNADIADIVPLTDRSVYVLGKSMGTTSLTLYDSGGRVLAVMDVAVGPDVEAFTDQIGRLIPNADIHATISGDSMVLTGLAYDAGAIDRAMQIAHTYAGDKVVNLIGLGNTQQVMLEVKFAEVNRSVGENLGIRTFFAGNNHPWAGVTGPGANATGSATINPDGTITGSVTGGVAAISNSFGIIGRTFSDVLGLNGTAVLNALEAKGFAKTLAEPTLIALSGEKASFLAGGEFPIPVAQGNRGGGGNNNNGGGFGAVTVEFKPFGVSLGFTPTILGDNTINLRVEPEVSSIDPAASIQINGISIPGLQTRRASTVLELRDGESFAIAGLLQKDFQTTVNQVPLLGNIPIIGALFRSTDFQKGETELLIVVTPHLVRPIRPDQVRLPTDAVRDPDAGLTAVLGEAYDPVPASELATPQAQPLPQAPEAPPEDDDGYEY